MVSGASPTKQKEVSRHGPHTLIVQKGPLYTCGNTSFFLSLLTLLLLLFLCCSCDNSPTIDFKNASDKNEEKESTMTIAPKETLRVAIGAMLSPEITRQYYEELIQLIAGKADRRAVFSQRRTYAEINQMMQDREIDVAFVCSGPYTQGHKDFGMEILAAPVVHGRQVYYSYILAHRDSDIQTFSDLKGHRFAFTDPNSNTGFIVPNYMLTLKDETAKSFFAETFFTYSHDNSIKAVAEGLADGAAVDSLIWEFMDTVAPRDTSRTKIVAQSEPFGIPPVVVHPLMKKDLKSLLQEIFLSIHLDSRAAKILRELQIDAFAEGSDSNYESVRKMQRHLKTQCREGEK